MCKNIKKWIYYDNLKKRSSWEPLSHVAQIDRKKFCPIQLMRLRRAHKKKRNQWSSRHDKTIVLYDNVNPHVTAPIKNDLGALKWGILPHPPYSSTIASFNYHLLWSMANCLSEHHFTSKEDTKNRVRLWKVKKLNVLPVPKLYAVRKIKKNVEDDGHFYNN